MRDRIPTLLGAAALGLAAAGAHAQAQMYGTLDAGLYSKQLSGEARIQSLASGNMSTSNFGFRGSEDLGDGLRAMFDMSGFMRVDTGDSGRAAGDPFFARFAWVGLQNQWGALRLGRQSSPSFINAIRFGPFGDSMALGPFLLHTYMPSATQPMMTSQGASDSGWSNAVGYVSPSLSGLVVSLLAAPSEGTTAGRRVGGSVSYGSGPFAGTLSFETMEHMSLNFSKPPTSVLMTDARSVQAGASYDLQVVKLFAQLARTRLTNATTEITLRTSQFGASVPMGGGQVLASWGHTSKTQTALADDKRDTIALGYDYDLSKRTDLYAVVLDDKVQSKARGSSIAVGIRHRF